MSNRLFLISLAIVTLAIACDKPESESVVASVGEFTISDRHMENQLRRFYMRTGQAVNLNEDVRLAVVNSRIERYTIVEIARERGWATDSDAIYAKAQIERKAMMEEYQRRFIHDRVQVSDADLRELFLRFNTSLRASHIHARTRDEADSLYHLIQAGASFEALAKARFKSDDLASTGGDLGYFTVDEMDLGFEAAAYSMEIGDISKPVATSTGYSIIKLTDRITVPLLTEIQFAEKKADLTPLALEQKRELATRADLDHHISRFSFDEAVMRRVWNDIQQQPAVYTRQVPELTEIALPYEDSFRAKVIAKDGPFEFTVGEWMKEAWYTSPERRASAQNYSDFKEQLQAMAYRNYALEVIQFHPNVDKEYVQAAIDETFYSYLFERFEQQIANDVVLNEDEIRAEWNRNQSSYIHPLEMNFAELMVTDSTLAEEVATRLRAGADFRNLLRRHGLNLESKERNGELGFIPITYFGAIQTRLHDSNVGEIRGPFQLETNRFVIFRVLGRREARQMTFGEAVPVIRERLEQVRKEQLRTAIIAEGRTRYNATIDLEKLNSITFEL